MIEPKRDIKSLLEYYKQDAAQQYANILILGAVAAGKTSLIATMPKPILLYSFDPSGTKAEAMRKEIQAGNVVPATRFEKISESTVKTQINEFEKTVMSIRNSGEINKFKTVAIDSYTTMAQMYEWNQGLKDLTKNDTLPTLHDYNFIIRYLSNMIISMCNDPCHFVMTGHLSKEIEEMTGRETYQIDAYRTMRTKLPMYFDHCFVMRKTQKASGIKHELVTNSPLFSAKKRSSNLDDIEEPDLTAVMNKIGGLDTKSIPLQI